MNERLKQELVIDFKAEMKNPRGRPKTEPDWDNRKGERIKVSTPGDSEQIKAEVIRILKRCLARLEGTEPQQAWEPRSKSWPYTSMGLALVKVIDLIDTLADRARAESQR